MPKIKALYLKAGVDEEPEIIEIDRDNKEKIRELLEIENIVASSRSIGGKDFFVIYSPMPGVARRERPSGGMNETKGTPINGNLLVCKIDMIDGVAEIGSLTRQEENRIFKNICDYGDHFLLIFSKARKEMTLRGF